VSLEITTEGVYDLTAEIYHADPVPERLGYSLSVSGAKKLLPPSCPAIYEWGRRNPQPHKDAFDFGHAAHSLVLGVGAEIKVLNFPDWRTKAAQDMRDDCYRFGLVPLLAADYEQVKAMAEAIKSHPVASALLNPENGKPEQALFRQDEQGVWLRSMLDWLPNPSKGRMVIPDYKSCLSAAPARFRKSFADYGYFQQAAWYLDMAIGLGLADTDAAFILIAQEKTAPYLVTVFEPDQESLRVGRELNRRAIDIYAESQSSGIWSGYSSDVELLSLPSWFVRQQEVS
jgi:hypothetical protein